MSDTPTTTQPPSQQERPQKKNHIGAWLGSAGGVLLVIGMVIGFTEVEYCGTPFAPDSSAAELIDTLVGADGYAAQCPEDLAGPTMAAWALIGIGVALLITGIVLANTLNRPAPTAPAAPAARTAADRLVDLDRLHKAGTISEDEYQAKRAKLLDEL